MLFSLFFHVYTRLLVNILIGFRLQIVLIPCELEFSSPQLGLNGLIVSNHHNATLKHVICGFLSITRCNELKVGSNDIRY